MRASKLHLTTYRETPAEAEIPSHKLMWRSGLIFKVASGVYMYSPLMLRVLRKVEKIVRDVLNEAGALEVQMPILQPKELWESSGRWEAYLASGTMFVSTGRNGADYGLAPTAEEVVTAYAKHTVLSYKQLPLNLYQIHTKFRDELRPRFGLLRGREFLMMDSYSFDTSADGLDEAYERMRLAYHEIFRRMGLQVFGVDADSGEIGGAGSMEFMVAAETGEDSILIEESSSYAANIEKAISRVKPSPSADADLQAMTIEDTPNVRTCAELEQFFPDLPKSQMVKTILYRAEAKDEDTLWAVLIRGDQEINEVKLKNHTQGLKVTRLAEDEISKLTGAKMGFAGPVNLSSDFKIVADNTVKGVRNFICGVNQTDKHALNVNLERDIPLPPFADLRLAREGEAGPKNGDPLVLKKGIEIGHIFKLGDKYSSAMNACCANEKGEQVPFMMGCYGIGISRVVAAAVEQFADEKGIAWPVSLAPFEVVVAPLDKKGAVFAEAERLYESLLKAGLSVVFEDRKLSFGALFNDLELLGFPYWILVGRSWKKEGMVEVRTRFSDEVQFLEPEAAVNWVKEQVLSRRVES